MSRGVSAGSCPARFGHRAAPSALGHSPGGLSLPMPHAFRWPCRSESTQGNRVGSAAIHRETGQGAAAHERRAFRLDRGRAPGHVSSHRLQSRALKGCFELDRCG